MIDLTLDKKEKESYIVDLVCESDAFYVLYANGRKDVCTIVTPHNIEMYRNRMKKNFLSCKNEYLTLLNLKVGCSLAAKYITTLTLIIGMYFNYAISGNVFTSLLFLGCIPIKNFFIKLYLAYLSYFEEEIRATDFYLAHFATDTEEEMSPILGIEEISQRKLTCADLEEILKKEESMSKTLKLSNSKIDKNKI